MQARHECFVGLKEILFDTLTEDARSLDARQCLNRSEIVPLPVKDRPRARSISHDAMAMELGSRGIAEGDQHTQLHFAVQHKFVNCPPLIRTILDVAQAA